MFLCQGFALKNPFHFTHFLAPFAAARAFLPAGVTLKIMRIGQPWVMPASCTAQVRSTVTLCGFDTFPPLDLRVLLAMAGRMSPRPVRIAPAAINLGFMGLVVGLALDQSAELAAIKANTFGAIEYSLAPVGTVFAGQVGALLFGTWMNAKADIAVPAFQLAFVVH